MGQRGSLSGDRHGYWFPLVLTGSLLFGALALRRVPVIDPARFAERRGDADVLQTTAIVAVMDEEGPPTDLGLGWFGFIGVAAAFLATVAWYAWRARRGGPPVPARSLVGIVVGGLLAIAVGPFLLAMLGRSSDGKDVAWTLGSSLALLGLCAGAWWQLHLGPARRVAAALCGIGLAGAGCIGIVSLRPGMEEALLVTVGLLVLAWLERSALLAGVAVVFLAATWVSVPGVPEAVIPAAVLVVGGVVALVVRERGAPA